MAMMVLLPIVVFLFQYCAAAEKEIVPDAVSSSASSVEEPSKYFEWNAESTKKIIDDLNSKLTESKTLDILTEVKEVLFSSFYIGRAASRDIQLEESLIKNKYAKIRLFKIQLYPLVSKMLPLEPTGKYTFQTNIALENITAEAHFSVLEQVTHFGAFCLYQWDFWLPCKPVRRLIRVEATLDQANIHFEGGAQVYKMTSFTDHIGHFFDGLRMKFVGQPNLNYIRKNLAKIWIDEVQLTLGKFTVPRNKDDYTIITKTIRQGLGEDGVYRKEYLTKAEKTVHDLFESILQRQTIKPEL